VARYANHSCNPNAELYQRGLRMFVRTLRRIKPGEEITYHYGMDYLRNVIGISNCRCGRCRRRKARKQREARALKKRRAMRASKARARR
jgi:SET domain-containing protein